MRPRIGGHMAMCAPARSTKDAGDRTSRHIHFEALTTRNTFINLPHLCL